MEPGVQTPDHTLRTGIGSCRDSAWLLVSILRQLGLAARFVPGYLVQLTSDVEALDGPSGPGGRLHRPARVDRGVHPRRGLDRPGPDVGAVRRRGSHPAVGDAASRFGRAHHRRDRAVRDDARVRQHGHPGARGPAGHAALHAKRRGGRSTHSAPASTSGWRQATSGSPSAASRRSSRSTTRSTRSGRRTPTARTSASAHRLSPRRLKRVWAPGGLVQHSQGKWYPGEPLPRWQIGLHWRTDGEPLWTDDALLADPWPTRPQTIAMSPDAGAQLLGAIADGLGLPASQVRPAFEDPLARLVSSRYAGRRANPSRPTTTSRPTPPTAVPPCSPGSTSRSPSPPLTCCRCTAATTNPAGPARTGRCGAAASCCWRASRPQVCGCRSTRSAGGHRGHRTRRPAGAARQSPGRCGTRRRRRLGSTTRIRTDHSSGRRNPGRAAARISAAHRRTGAFRRPGRPGAGRGGHGRLPAGDRGLRTAGGSAHHVDDHHARPGGYRGQRRPDGEFRRAARPAPDALRRSAPSPAVHRVVRRRRHARRNRRR